MICTMYDDRERAHLAIELALAMLAGPWTPTAVAEAGGAILGHWPSWLDALALHVTSVHRRAPDGRSLGALIGLIEGFLADRRAGPEHDRTPSAGAPPQRPPGLRHDWPLAAVPSVGELAAALELSDGQLAWLADVRGLERTVTAERLRNYRYAAIPRRSGLPRLIEAPKLRLEELQRWILREILDPVPVHEAALGFTRGRSIVDHARRHSGRQVVVRMDIADFFASVSAGRVFGIFRTLGYGRAVAHVLTGLTTNTVPQHVWRVVHEAATSAPVGARFALGRALAAPHLPQGAPTSPALANLAAFRLDRRLSGLAAAQGLRYSRYADDLTFSGARLRGGASFPGLVARIVRAEGFALNQDKTVLRTGAARQSVCGIVVNVAPNVTRGEYDRLKAILHNAARHGPAGQGPAADRVHLEGRIAWVASLNPARGDRLRRRFEQIDWSR